MLLSDRDIKAQIESGRVKLDPYEAELVQPSSIDVRLDRYFRVFENHRYPFIDPAVEQPDLTRLVETHDEEPFVLHPGEFVLASTYEVITLPDDVAARLEGKSSLGRLGLLTHSTAGWIDPGFSGHVTLELSNVATLPIKLWPGMKIGQMCLFRTSSPAEHPYGSAVYASRYQGQRGPTPSRSYLNFYRTKVLQPPAPALTPATSNRQAAPGKRKHGQKLRAGDATPIAIQGQGTSVSKRPVRASPTNERQAVDVYRMTGPRRPRESRTATVPVVEATSTHAPWFMLRIALRQLRRAKPPSSKDITDSSLRISKLD